MDKESVLVFPEGLIEDLIGNRRGFILNNNLNVFNKIINSDSLFFLERGEAEISPEYKQIIPYTIVKASDQIFYYQRSKKGNEDRLRNKWSIGFGGHINDKDGIKCNTTTYHKAWQRELDEELEIKGQGVNKIVGYIYDDSNEVGKVHFGIVHLFNLFNFSTINKCKSEEIICLSQDFPYNIQNMSLNFENWSKLILENLNVLEN